MTLLVAVMAGVLGASTMPLSVQVVDEGWLPLPGIDVRVSRTASCMEHPEAPQVQLATTNQNGWAEYDVESESRYWISAGGTQGFTLSERCVRLFGRSANSPRAYVQLRLTVDVPSDENDR